MGKKLQKILAFLLVISMMLSFAACNGKPPKTSDTPTDDTPSEDQNTPPDNKEENPNDKDDTVKYKPLADYLKEMSLTPYRVDATVKEQLGLSDASVVGVDEERYKNEELYPVPEDSFFGDKIYNVWDYGIVPNGEANAQKLNELIISLADVEGPKKIVFKPEVYLIEKTIKIENVEDVYITSEDPTKHFEVRLTSWFQGFSINYCENLHINYMDYDYVISPTVAGEIIGTDIVNKHITLKIYDEFDLSHPLYNGGFFNRSHSYVEFKPDHNGEYVPYNHMLYNNDVSVVSYDHETREITLRVSTNSIEDVEIGTRGSIAYTMYDYFGMHIRGVDGMYFEDVNMYTAGGMGFGSVKNNLYMNRVDLNVREGSTRLMTATADGLHCIDCPEVKVTNSTFQYSHDDSMNIKGYYLSVTRVDGRTITLKCTSDTDIPVRVGDVLEIYETEKFGSRGVYTVEESVEISAREFIVTLDKDPEYDLLGCIAGNVSRATKLHLENSILGNKRNRGMLVQCRDSVIKGNTFRNIMHGTICIFTIRDSFNEGICPNNVQVINNKFLGGTAGVIFYNYGTSGVGTPGTLKNMKVDNNFFYGTTATVDIKNTADSSVSNNLFYNIGIGGISGDDGSCIVASNNTNLTVIGNRSYHDVYNKKYKILSAGNGEGLVAKDNIYKGLDKITK